MTVYLTFVESTENKRSRRSDKLEENQSTHRSGIELVGLELCGAWREGNPEIQPEVEGDGA
jgi:hypothetical protein